MALARKELQIQDAKGNVQTDYQVEVRRETSGQPLEPLFSDRDGLEALANPFTVSSPTVVAAFHCAGGSFQVKVTKGTDERIMRYVPVGTAGEVDAGPLVGAQDASDIPFTPAGNIEATDVQAAAEELDTEKEAADSATLKSDESENLTVGYTATAHNGGTQSTGTYTPDPADGNLQHYINGGAHTLAPPSATGDYTLVIQITNDSSAGAITTSGFTRVTGDSFTTTDGHDFLGYITKLNGLTHLHVTALQ